MSGGGLARLAAATIVLLMSTAVASIAGDAGPADCKSGPDKQAVIKGCSAVIARTRDPRVLEKSYNRRGLAHERLGEFREAAQDFSEVIALNPSIAGYFDNRMRALKGLGKLDLALKDAEAAVRLAPGYPFAYHGRGAVRFDMGLYAMAVQDFTAALAINAADAPLLVDRGRALDKLGMTDRALSDYTRSHEVDPAFLPALRERGLLLARLNRGDEAKADLAAVLAGGAQDKEAVAAYARLTGGDAASGVPAPVGRASSSLVGDAGEPPAVKLTLAAAGELTPTQRAEQEATRRLQDLQDAEKARQEAAARLKAERRAQASDAAKSALASAAEFVRSTRDDPDLMEHLGRITDLNASLAAGDPATIERKTAVLTAALAADPLYAAFVGRRVTENGLDAARDLDIAVRTLRVQKSFLVQSVVADPTGAASGSLLGLARKVDEVVASPALGPAQTLVGTIDAAIDSAGLRASYEAARAVSATDATRTVTQSAAPAGSASP